MVRTFLDGWVAETLDDRIHGISNSCGTESILTIFSDVTHATTYKSRTAATPPNMTALQAAYISISGTLQSRGHYTDLDSCADGVRVDFSDAMIFYSSLAEDRCIACLPQVPPARLIRRRRHV